MPVQLSARIVCDGCGMQAAANADFRFAVSEACAVLGGSGTAACALQLRPVVPLLPPGWRWSFMDEAGTAGILCPRCLERLPRPTDTTAIGAK